MDVNTMTDKQLVRELLYRNEWNQADLAERFGVTQPIISRVLNEKQKLRPAVRVLAEKLFHNTQGSR